MKRGLVDVSNVIWTCLMAGKDTEHGKTVKSEAGKEVHVNSAGFGYENVVNHLDKAMADLGLVPHQLIFAVEGRESKRARLALFPGYKGKSDRIPEQYEAFNACKQMVLDQFLALGAQAVTQDGIEADDVLGYLAHNLEGWRYIISGDKDLAQVVGPGPRDRLRLQGGGRDTTGGRGQDDSAWTGYIHHYRQGQLDKNPFGPFPHHLIPVAIALVGDPADKIPGARGFGQKSLEEMLVAFGVEGLNLMDGLIRNRQLIKLQEDVAELKSLLKIIDGADGVYLSYALGKLMIDRVNTINRPLQWTVGMVKPRTPDTDERLRRHAGTISIVSAENYEASLPQLKRLIEQSPYVALDIETSTPPESDAWLTALDKTEDRTPVDVFGSELTSLQITFGPNLQYTAYLPVDNIEQPGCTNLTVDQVRDIVALVPRATPIKVHFAQFELPVCYMAWGAADTSDPDFHGFLPNVHDTKIGASYVDENESQGLKNLSKRLLNYEQTTYDQVTTKDYTLAEWDARPESSMGQKGDVLSNFFAQVGTGEYDKGEAIAWSHANVLDHEGQPVFDAEGAPVTELVAVEWDRGAEIMTDGPAMVRVQHKMNQLTAAECVDYGADDTICTAALANHPRAVMEIENTWAVYLEVEQLPAYVTAKAFVDGVDFSLEHMRAMEKDDDIAYDKAWATLREYLISIGFDGVNPPVFDKLDPAAIKQAHLIVTGVELNTMIRTPDKLVKLIDLQADESTDEDYAGAARVLTTALASALKGETTLEAFNQFVASKFSGEPKLDLGSSKQVAALLYDRMRLPVRIVNKATENERINKPELAYALRKFQKIRSGNKDLVLDDDELTLIRTKAKADDVAIDTALAFDTEIVTPEIRAALKAIGTLKSVLTRRNLFYKNYWNVLHWKDGKVHANANQAAAVTRRYSMSNPNLQQLPKKGEAVRFRGGFKPHHKRAVIASIDWSGQELRLAAERSQDKNLLACYVGTALKDVHSLTAAFAMKLKWGFEEVQRLYTEHQPMLMHSPENDYTLFLHLRSLGKADPWGKKADDLRKESKNVNFTAQFGGSAPKVAETLIMSLEDAQLFLDARAAMFPDVDVAAERAAEECSRLGYAMTFMGARRHLAKTISSDDAGAASRAARQAWNFEIQGSAGEMAKLAMARVWASGVLYRFDVVFIAIVHDELVFSVAEEHAVQVIRIIHECMTQPYSTMTVPILGSISLGPDFAEQHECGDWFIEDNIRKALNDTFTQKVAA
jgi:DNA polymerase I-like protein with 3'-5' exonuclease and polymerase domains/5'-3' exonuclease